MGNICGECVETKSEDIELISDDALINIRSFSVLRLLGQGSFGKVLLVMKKDNKKLYAMKVISKKKLVDETRKTHALSERNILAEVKSEFVVKLHHAFENSLNLYMVLEYMHGGDLYRYMKEEKPVKESVVRFCIAEVCLALEDLHRSKIIYRDLKPENILIDSKGHLKLTDFNLAKLLHSDHLRSRTLCGTPEYIAPEVLTSSPEGIEIDFWSLGVLLYEMLTGSSPFLADSHEKLFENILAGNYRREACLSEEAASLVEILLKVDPAERPACVEQIKFHEFFNGVNWSDVRNKKVLSPLSSRKNPVEGWSRRATNSPLESETFGPNYNGFTYVGSVNI